MGVFPASLIVHKPQSTLSVEFGQVPAAGQRPLPAGIAAGPLWPLALPDRATMGKSQDRFKTVSP